VVMEASEIEVKDNKLNKEWEDIKKGVDYV
jgi:hypothetical protein